MNDINQVIHRAVEYLNSQQQSNGKFVSYQSQSANDFSHAQATNSLFATALIGCALEEVPSASQILSRAAEYLWSQKSADCSWNYLDRQQESNYPDDLDDTACALAAVLVSGVKLDGRQNARLLGTLMACEQQPGGPYRTWVTSSTAKAWRDIDMAVNANLAFLYKKLGISASGLNDYLTNAIRHRKLRSPYYCGVAPLLYFLARGYSGPATRRLRRLVLVELNQTCTGGRLAILLSAACRLGVERQILQPFIEQLIAARDDSHWPAEAFYTDSPINKEKRYAGAESLTTALAVEALSLWSNCPIQYSPSPRSARTAVGIYRQRRAKYLHLAQPPISDAAGVLARSLGWHDSGMVGELNKLHLDGWLAYEIFDNIADDSADINMLGMANILSRKVIDKLSKLVGQPKFSRYVQQTFDRMDKSLSDEVWQARDINNLPDYPDRTDLALRSWGFSLAPIAVMLLNRYKFDSQPVRRLQDFLRHYLVAKQICDDAHDWEDDLANSRATYVLAGLLRQTPGAELVELRRYFWGTYVLTINEQIREELKLAQQDLEELSIYLQDTAELQAWLAGIEQSCAQAEYGRQEILEFIAELEGQHLLQ